MKHTLVILSALAILVLIPGCKTVEKQSGDPRGHAHRVRAGRPSPVVHHPAPAMRNGGDASQRRP